MSVYLPVCLCVCVSLRSVTRLILSISVYLTVCLSVFLPSKYHHFSFILSVPCCIRLPFSSSYWDVLSKLSTSSKSENRAAFVFLLYSSSLVSKDKENYKKRRNFSSLFLLLDVSIRNEITGTVYLMVLQTQSVSARYADWHGCSDKGLPSLSGPASQQYRPSCGSWS